MTREAEAQMIRATGHEVFCFETYAENAVETGLAETGWADEELGGVRLIDFFVDQSKTNCECKRAAEEVRAQAEADAE